MTDFSAHRVPDGAIVLHIGPHKTGTTTIQGALGQHRNRLRDLDVIYPGAADHEMNASMAAGLGKVNPGQAIDHHLARWEKLVAEIHRETATSGSRRGVLSSEFYCEAPPDRIDWMMERLGPRTRVVITLRPLAKILPSQWQQYIQNQHVISYDEWLEAILENPEPGKITPTFWRRHNHANLIRKWSDAVGVDRISVIAVDDRDRGFILRAFEGLLGLPAATLDVENTTRNRSLSYAEVELLRAFNAAAKAAKIAPADYTRFIRFGAARVLQTANLTADQAPLLTPQWAVERANELESSFVAEIKSLGLELIGDLDLLADPALAPAIGQNGPVTLVDAEVAATLAAGLARHLAAVPTTPVSPKAGPAERATAQRHRLEALTAPGPVGPRRTALAGEIARRIRGRLLR